MQFGNLASYTITFTIVYALAMLAIGYYAWKKTSNTPEDFFMGSRRFGTLAFMWSVYATNMTAVYILGTPGNAYRLGAGTLGYMSAATVIGVVFTFYFIGYRIWLLGKARGYMTPTEMFSDRWNSEAINVVLFILLFILTIGYACSGLIGAGLAVVTLTDGLIPYWAGAAGTIGVVLIYTAFGGMRGTAWTNIGQGFIFHLFVIFTFFLIAGNLGGLDVITNRMLAEAPKLLANEGNFTPQQWFSWLLIPPMAVICFPHVFIRIMTGKTHVTLKRYVWLTPILHITGWTPVVLVGLWGVVIFPGLDPKSSDAIYPMMAAKYLHPLIAGVALAAVWSVVQSTLDAMMLTLSAMFTRDIVRRYWPSVSVRSETTIGRVLVVVFAILALILALIQPATIFDIAKVAFTGYVMTMPMMFAGLYWKRSTKWGVLSGLIVTSLLLWVYTFTPWLNFTLFGFMPIIPLTIINIALIVVVSYLTPRPEERHVRRFFDVLDPVFGRKAPAVAAPRPATERA